MRLDTKEGEKDFWLGRNIELESMCISIGEKMTEGRS